MRAKKLSIEDVCIACHRVESNITVSQHPYFFGGICELCKVGELSATHKTQALIMSIKTQNKQINVTNTCFYLLLFMMLFFVTLILLFFIVICY